MKALTICQPYAHLIATGEKLIENRGWPTSYRGPLAIHAGKSREWLDGEDEAGMVFGAVVAVATLAECLRLNTRWPPRFAALETNEHANGPWCWMLTDIRRVEPVPCRGFQGLWDLMPAEFSYVEDIPA